MVDHQSSHLWESLRAVEPLIPKLEEIEEQSREIAFAREQLLGDASTLIVDSMSAHHGDLGLNFICTHNSRRSHLSQVWAAVASAAYGLGRIRCLSGGTEATACNPRIVQSLRRAGFSVVTSAPLETNPTYLLQFSDVHVPVSLHSKRYDDPCNRGSSNLPTSGVDNKDIAFIAMMCCDHADQHCPVIAGSVGRVALHYRDPKESDDTEKESSTYDERRDEIGAEMFFLMRMVAEKS